MDRPHAQKSTMDVTQPQSGRSEKSLLSRATKVKIRLALKELRRFK